MVEVRKDARKSFDLICLQSTGTTKSLWCHVVMQLHVFDWGKVLTGELSNGITERTVSLDVIRRLMVSLGGYSRATLTYTLKMCIILLSKKGASMLTWTIDIGTLEIGEKVHNLEGCQHEPQLRCWDAVKKYSLSAWRLITSVTHIPTSAVRFH